MESYAWETDAAPELHALGDGVWTCSDPLRFLGVAVGHRMAVVRSDSGDLLIYSPVSPTPAMRESLAAVGKVRDLVVPSYLHDTNAPEWMVAEPDLRLHISGPVVRDLRKYSHHDLRDSGAELEAHYGIQWFPIAGAPRLAETLLWVERVGALACCDAFFYFRNAPGFWSRWVLRFDQAYGQIAVPRAVRPTIKDRKAFADTFGALAQLPIQVLVPSHGELKREGAAAFIADVASGRWVSAPPQEPARS